MPEKQFGVGQIASPSTVQIKEPAQKAVQRFRRGFLPREKLACSRSSTRLRQAGPSEVVWRVGNEQKSDTFAKERSSGYGSVVGLPEQVVVAFAALGSELSSPVS